jgi:hypothetical protein
MIKERAWPVRAMYILIAAALAIGLFITAAPIHKVSAADNEVVSEWDRVPTPTTEDWVLAPESIIMDYALALAGEAGEVAYAIIYSDYDYGEQEGGPWYLLKSEDGAATWENIIKGLNTEVDKKGLGEIATLEQVACDPEEADFVAVAAWVTKDGMHVFLSKDGGTTFKDAGKVEDGGVSFDNGDVFELEVSPAEDNERNIAIGGCLNETDQVALLFRSTATGDSASAWEDATDVATYKGWDDHNLATNFSSEAVVDIKFSPNWKNDKTILVLTVTQYDYDWDGYVHHGDAYLQIGSWGTETQGWNKESGANIAAVLLKHEDDIWFPAFAQLTGGITLPSDYDGKKADKRLAWVWVNYANDIPWYTSGEQACTIYRVANNSADPIGYQIEGGDLWLTNVSYWGTIDEGKAMAGVLGNGATINDDTDTIFTTCCTGVQVYRYGGTITKMDVCCPRWDDACKLPTGRLAMDAFYVSADKAYAVDLFDGPEIMSGGSLYDEGAWSVSFDDGNIWNQLSLIDTKIDYLSDVAVSPDCNKTFLVSVNKVIIDQGRECPCDSVWVHAADFPEEGYSEYSGHWLRTWCGELLGNNSGWFDEHPERGLLRLLPGETTGDTVYLVDRMYDAIYWLDMETLGCWEEVSAPPKEIDEIVDLAVAGNETLYALNEDGYVAVYHEGDWGKAVESKVDEGWTIAVHGDKILVGGYDGQVSYSSDTAKTFALLEEVPTIDGLVTVGFDTYFDTNKVIYAATAEITPNHDNYGGGIYRWVINQSEEWKDLGANHDYNYTGLLLSYSGGNTYTGSDTGGVLYASYVGETCESDWSTSDDWFNCWKDAEKCWDTGVARTLTPAGEIECEKCVEWDYLTVGLTGDEWFIAPPYALKMCGCTTPTTNTKLYAIGMDYESINDGEVSVQDDGGVWYDMAKAKWGTVWTFEDCYAKKAPELTSTSNMTIPADCYCSNLPFSIRWDGVCDACYYDLQIALDDQFTDVVAEWDYQEGGKDMLGATGLSYVVPDILTCEVTYYWRVRAHEASTCQIIHSWWSDAETFTVAPSAAQGAITLIAPVSGATDVGIKNVGFSWDLTATANKFDWVLSKNADLSSPIESKTGLTSKAYTYSNTLVHGTTYYWQVKAYNGGTLVSTSSVGVFTTGALGPYCDPIDGLCFDTQAELTAHEATAHPAAGTPFWVWVVIAIGAVLVIVVIVLIFRTRRV